MTEATDSPTAGRKRWLAITAFVVIAAIVGIGLWLSRQSGPEQVQAMVDADEILVSAKVAGRIDQPGSNCSR
jgi:multidrug resistance efflux pump